jgi:hypothetical protein
MTLSHFTSDLRQYVLADDTLIPRASAISVKVCCLMRNEKTSFCLTENESYITWADSWSHRYFFSIIPDWKIAIIMAYSFPWSTASSSILVFSFVKLGQSKEKQMYTITQFTKIRIKILRLTYPTTLFVCLVHGGRGIELRNCTLVLTRITGKACRIRACSMENLDPPGLPFVGLQCSNIDRFYLPSFTN